jgi:hypothetical protein
MLVLNADIMLLAGFLMFIIRAILGFGKFKSKIVKILFSGGALLCILFGEVSKILERGFYEVSVNIHVFLIFLAFIVLMMVIITRMFGKADSVKGWFLSGLGLLILYLLVNGRLFIFDKISVSVPAAVLFAIVDLIHICVFFNDLFNNL